MTTSLLQSPRRPSSDALAFDLHAHRDPGQRFSASGGLGGYEDEPDTVDLGRELDLSDERPQAAESGRGPGLLVASIVGASLALAGIITMVRGDDQEVQATEAVVPGAITEGMSAPAELPAEPAAAEPVPPEPPSRVASQRVPTAAKAEPAPAEITPAAVAPASPARPTPSSPAPARPAAPAEVAPSGAIAPGLHLPPPVFDEPEPAEPEPAPTPPVGSPVDDASEPLPGIDERPPAEPHEDPGGAAPEPAAPEAAQPTHADRPVPFDEALDPRPARAHRPAS